MTRNLATLALAAVMATACGHKAELDYIQAAGIDLDRDLEKVLVINRSLPGNAGQTIMDVAEGWTTGEGFTTDHDMSRVALDGLIEVLNDTDRFDVTRLELDEKVVDSSLWDKALDPKTAKKLCRQHDCDALVSLDAFDTDTVATVHRTKGAPPTVTHDSNGVATFRTYDGRSGSIVDSERVRTQASSEAGVFDFATNGGVQDSISWTTGVSYGQRIAPHEVIARRAYYKTGSAEMREGKRQLKAGNVKAAMGAWRVASKSGDRKLAAKAKHNLAVANEVLGNVDRASALASKAAATLSRAKTQRYADEMAFRVNDAKRLAKQLGLDEEPAVADAPPRANIRRQ